MYPAPEPLPINAGAVMLAEDVIPVKAPQQSVSPEAFEMLRHAAEGRPIVEPEIDQPETLAKIPAPLDTWIRPEVPLALLPAAEIVSPEAERVKVIFVLAVRPCSVTSATQFVELFGSI